MSQFRDTFTKEEPNENLLNYDDNAFRFFAGCSLFCIIVPYTFVTLKKLLFGKQSEYVKNYIASVKQKKKIKYCRCSLCVNRVEDVIKKEKNYLVFFKDYTIFHLLILCFIWFIFVKICCSLSDSSQIGQFNPFEILEVDTDSTIKEIKKAYRLMSYRYHPDRNLDDPTVSAKFILITKAYQALTDEVAKENYQKYGNPDGPGVMKLGIGLPKFIVKKENQLLILCIFFLVLLVIIPMTFIIYYRRQHKYAPNGVHAETLQFLSCYMTEATRAQCLPEFLAASSESREMKLRSTDDDQMKELINQVVSPKRRQFNVPIIVRNYFLILGHMQRLQHLISEPLKKDLYKLLDLSQKITSSMIEIATIRDWCAAIHSVMEFRRCLIQALDIRDSSLSQLPYFDEEAIKHCHRGKNAIKDLESFVNRKAEDRKGINSMNPEQLADLEAVCSHLPNVTLEAEIVVTDEPKIVVGDIASCNITLCRKNLQEGEELGPIHAPYFPSIKYEEWWFLLTEKKNGKVLGFVRSKSREKNLKERILFRVGIAGQKSVVLAAMNDSYAGCDKTIEINFKAYAKSEVDREVYVHPEDANLDNEPTLFQQMLDELVTKGSSDEENDKDSLNESEIDTELKGISKSKSGNKSKNIMKKISHSDSNDDEDILQYDFD